MIIFMIAERINVIAGEVGTHWCSNRPSKIMAAFHIRGIILISRLSLHGREMWTVLKRDQVDVAGYTACERVYALAE